VRAEDPAAVWSVSEHLLATVSNWLAELTYITAVVNSEAKSAKQLTRPEPIVRPGQDQAVSRERQHPRHRQRVGPPLNPAEFGGAPMDTTAVEVKPA
jgi:hypothetical protein